MLAKKAMPSRRKEICDCGILERCSKEPEHPVRFDEKMNEYHIVHGEGGKMMIYYCPFCGGSIPKSRRGSFFAHVTSKEQHRIRSLFEGIKKEKDVLERFGPPDEELEIGDGRVFPGKENDPSRGEFYRTLIYKNLSETADIRFNISDGSQARGSWIQKYTGEKES